MIWCAIRFERFSLTVVEAIMTHTPPKLICRAGRGRGEGWAPIVVAVQPSKYEYTPTEKRAAVIVDRLCPVFIDKTGAYIGPETFKALVIRLAELL
jgi:hypothetical protein